VTGDGQARICEGLGVKFSGATRRDHEANRMQPVCNEPMHSIPADMAVLTAP